MNWIGIDWNKKGIINKKIKLGDKNRHSMNDWKRIKKSQYKAENELDEINEVK